MPNSIDAYAPGEIAHLVNIVGIKKAKLPILPLATLGLLAGVFIAFGAMFYTVVITGSTLGTPVGRHVIQPRPDFSRRGWRRIVHRQ